MADKAFSHLSDPEVIDRIKSGQNELFKLLVDRHEASVRTVVSGIVGSQQAEVMDIAQETFIKLYEKIHLFEGKSSLKTYLIRIAINQSLNELAKRKRRSKIIDIRGLDIPMYENGNKEDFELREWIQQGLSKLDHTFRKVFVLRVIEGFSTEDTASILEIPEGTVGSRLNRAYEKLREILTQLDTINKY